MADLSQAMKDTLLRALTLYEEHGGAGYFPHDAGTWSTVRALEKRGLLRYEGRGIDIDGTADGNEVAIFQLTGTGLSSARELDGRGGQTK